jgi:hypothetical protein
MPLLPLPLPPSLPESAKFESERFSRWNNTTMDATANTLRASLDRAPKDLPKRLPICVTFVMREGDSAADAKEFREFCAAKGLLFETRVYDSWRYRQDRDEIQRLPALHIAVNGRWERTFYPLGRPYQHIQEVVQDYLERLERKRAKKGLWKRRLVGFAARVRGWFHRPTALEKAEAAEAARRASMTTATPDLAERFSGLVLADWE